MMRAQFEAEMLNMNGELQKLRRQSAAWEMTQTTGDGKVRERNSIQDLRFTWGCSFRFIFLLTYIATCTVLFFFRWC